MSPKRLQQAADTPSPMSSSPYPTEILSHRQLELGATPSIPFEEGNQGPFGSPSNTVRASFVGSRGLQHLLPDGPTNQHNDHGRFPQLADWAYSSHPASSAVITPSGITADAYEPTNTGMGSQQAIDAHTTSARSYGNLDHVPKEFNAAQSKPGSSAVQASASSDIWATMFETNVEGFTTEPRRPHNRGISREQSRLPPKYPRRATKHTVNELQNQGTQDSRMHGTPLLEHRVQGDKDWHAAVMHADISGELQRRANLRSYDRFPPAKGPSPGDETAPVEGHEDWGPARQNRPAILFHLIEHVPVIPACIPTPFMFDGYRVLDRKKQWMTHWDDVPVTCSSMIEGHRIEALMRRNPALQHWDILARMPDRFLFKNRMSSPFLPSTLTNRTKRFRARSFNIAWRGRQGSSQFLLSQVKSMLPAYVVLANSTYGYRDPDKVEVKKLLAATGSQEQHDSNAAYASDEEALDNPNEFSSPARTTALEIKSGSRHIGPLVGNQLRYESSQSSDDPGVHSPHVKRRRAPSGIEAANKKTRRQQKRNATEPRPGSTDTFDQTYRHGINRTGEEFATNKAVPNSGLSYRPLDHGRNQFATEDGDLRVLQTSQGARAALQRSSMISSVYTPLHGPQSLSHSDFSHYPTQYNPLHPDQTGSLPTYELDLYFQAGNELINEFLGGDIATPFQSQEPLFSDSPPQNEPNEQVSAEVRLEHGKTYIFICLDSAKATKCAISVDGYATSEILSQPVLAAYVQLLKDERPLQKGKAVLRDVTDQKLEHEQEPDHTGIDLPVDVHYIIVCMEDRRFDKAITLEGLETPWDEIEYSQLVDEIANLERPQSDEPIASVTQLPEDYYDAQSSHQRPNPTSTSSFMQHDQLREGQLPVQSGYQASGLNNQATSLEETSEAVESGLPICYDPTTGTTANEIDPEGADFGIFLGAPINDEVGPNNVIKNLQRTPDGYNGAFDTSELPTYTRGFQ